VNHPYNYTIAEKVYLVSVSNPADGEYVVLEIVDEPWQWLSAAGIVMLILGGVLLFIRGPRKTFNSR
jgi:LPXTG-motif cell wall-anchored protein